MLLALLITIAGWPTYMHLYVGGKQRMMTVAHTHTHTELLVKACMKWTPKHHRRRSLHLSMRPHTK